MTRGPVHALAGNYSDDHGAMPRIGAVLIKLNQVLTWPRLHREKESFCKTGDPKSRQNSTLRICHDDGNSCPVTKV